MPDSKLQESLPVQLIIISRLLQFDQNQLMILDENKMNGNTVYNRFRESCAFTSTDESSSVQIRPAGSGTPLAYSPAHFSKARPQKKKTFQK